ncbi:MAG: hypothetical protein IJW40_09690 [Clostridia bacterium]|nr:hypothetical protein [Clostridia bacterium]
MIKSIRKMAVALAVLLLAVSLGGCAENLPDMAPSSYESRVLQAWSTMMLTEADRMNDTLVLYNAIYDIQTGELIRGYCEDPECDGECYLERGYCFMHSLVGDRMYFSVFVPQEDMYYFCYREISTGSVQLLFTLPEEERGAFESACVDGKYYYYYSNMQLKEGGNPDLLSDYLSYISRYDMESGTHEVVYECRSGMDILYYVIDGILYTAYQGGFWRTDLATMQQTLLIDHGALGYREGFVSLRYLDGYFYEIAIPANGGGRQLLRFDAVSGEHAVLVDEPVATYALTNDAIYFFPQQPMRPIGEPVRGEGGEEEYEYIGSDTIYTCNHDGSGVRPVWTDESGLIDLIGVAFTVFEDIYYGDIRIFDLETNAFGERFFAEIHFDTGEIIRAIEVE